MKSLHSLLRLVLLTGFLAACAPVKSELPSGSSQSTLPDTPPAMATPSTEPEATLFEIDRESLAIDLGDFVTQAELTFPAGEAGPFPTVILLHGSAPSDMDYARYSTWGGQRLLSRNFLDIANYLSRRGFAVLRFNKHYVSGPGKVDWEKYDQNITIDQLVADAEKVLATALANTKVNPNHIFIFGWSEGSVVGTQVALKHPELAGLILQGPLARPFREIRKSQVLEVGVPYLRTISEDGYVTSDDLMMATIKEGGEIAKSVIIYLVDPVAAQKGKIVINPEIDTNGDGRISLDEEFLPILDTFLQFVPSYPIPSEFAGQIQVPVLVLQGENDSATFAKDVPLLDDAFRIAGHTDFRLIVYPGLGHSLGKAESLIADNFRPIEPQPLQDLADWLREYSQ